MWLAVIVLTHGIVAAEPAAPPEPTPEGIAFFEKRIRPILVEHCYSCHSTDAKKVRGELLLDTRDALRKGGQTGPAIVPGKVESSLLIKAVRHVDETLRMPPKEKLSPQAIADLEAWIKMGAPDPRLASLPRKRAEIDIEQGKKFWSFQPLKTNPPPAVRDEFWSLTPIDRFIQAEHEKRRLQPAPIADRRTLIRRVTYDLTGLPPTPEEIAAALSDKSQDWYEKVVDRLLASPAYGERWGRHWLDVVRYADTAGDNSDYPVPQLYKYRNWVLRAFAEDRPYDQFIREQLAGDLLPSADDNDRFGKLIATGYLGNTRRFGSYEEARYPWHLTVEDSIDNLGRTFLGLTINCARCHDHKFDPILNEDYYALYGFFSSTRYPFPGIELDKAPRDLIPLVPRDRAAILEKERQQQLAQFDADIQRLGKDKAAAEAALREAGKTKDAARIAQSTKRLNDLKENFKTVQVKRERLGKQPLSFDLAYAVAEGKNEGKRKVGNVCVQIKGDPERLGKEVPRRFPMVLGGQTLPADVKGSGRLQLANWIADSKNPLTARVMVNRIWHYHFGKGLVQTPSDFGKQGRAPTHPELLDYLAARFIDSGWSVKAMHRLIILSRTYQLGGQDDSTNAGIDQENDYLWRFTRRRLDAESIRDTLLAVSGSLDRSPGGPHPFPDQTTWNFTQHNPFKAVYDTNRRSVYLMTQRIQRHPFLALFDGADTNASTAKRDTSTTPLQALYLMNDPFVHEQARTFAARLLAGKKDDGGCIEEAYLLVYGRQVTVEEKAAAQEYLSKVRERLKANNVTTELLPQRCWESFARVLFGSNEFVYLD